MAMISTGTCLSAITRDKTGVSYSNSVELATPALVLSRLMVDIQVPVYLRHMRIDVISMFWFQLNRLTLVYVENFSFAKR